MKWRELVPYLQELWHRPAGPMNWKNPIRVFAVAGWGLVQGLVLLGWAVFRAGQFVVALPALVLFFFAGLWYAVWSFVRRPFPSLDENPLLALVNYHTPNFFDWLVIWYYVSPFVAVMLSGLLPSPFGRSGWRGGGATSHPSPSSRRGRLIPNKRLQPSSSERSITRLRRERFSVPRGSPSRSADCIPAWRSSEPWDQAKHRLA